MSLIIDTITLASHLETFKENIGEEKFSETEALTADAGYGSEENFYVCPMGQRMEKTYENTTKTKNGFIQKQSHYQAKNCSGCPLGSRCHQSRENRSIERNHNLERHKELARKRLKSEGIQKRKKRCYDVEPVFAHLKNNHHFKRFMLKSIKKVEIGFGLHALAHNLRKKVA